MTIDRRLLAGALGISLVAAACGGSSTASSTPAPAASQPAATAAATAAPTTEPTAEPTEAATTEPTDDSGGLPGTMTGLAAMLPEEAGGVTFNRVGFSGDQLALYGAGAGLNEEQFGPILKANGKTISDVNFAIAGPTSSGGSAATIYALQIEGVKATESMGAMGLETSGMQQVTLGGKKVWAQASAGVGIWAYPKDDIVFVIFLASEDVAKAVLEQLP